MRVLFLQTATRLCHLYTYDNTLIFINNFSLLEYRHRQNIRLSEMFLFCFVLGLNLQRQHGTPECSGVHHHQAWHWWENDLRALTNHYELYKSYLTNRGLKWCINMFNENTCVCFKAQQSVSVPNPCGMNLHICLLRTKSYLQWRPRNSGSGAEDRPKFVCFLPCQRGDSM